MDGLLPYVEGYGPVILFALGFLEYAGVPIASVPFLVAAGALARMDVLDWWQVVPLAAAGGWTADAIWYGLARRGGNRFVGAACSLSPKPSSCVTYVEKQVVRLGAPYILSAKFLPAVGNLIAPAAGFGRYPAARFLALDAAALLLWAAAYSGLGWVFSSQVESVIAVVESYATWALALAAGLVIAGGAVRYKKSRAHAHGSAPD